MQLFSSSLLFIALCSREYTDLASIGALPKYTGGQLYSYPSFTREKDGVKLSHEIVHNLTRTTGKDSEGLKDLCKQILPGLLVNIRDITIMWQANRKSCNSCLLSKILWTMLCAS